MAKLIITKLHVLIQLNTKEKDICYNNIIYKTLQNFTKLRYYSAWFTKLNIKNT